MRYGYGTTTITPSLDCKSQKLRTMPLTHPHPLFMLLRVEKQWTSIIFFFIFMGGREEICLSPPFVSFITPTLEILPAAAENIIASEKKAAFYERKQLPSNERLWRIDSHVRCMFIQMVSEHQSLWHDMLLKIKKYWNGSDKLSLSSFGLLNKKDLNHTFRNCLS